MGDAPPEEIRAVAALPGLGIEIRHRADAGGETLAITLTGAPTLRRAAERLAPPFLALPPAAAPLLAPFEAWALLVEAAWRPWLALLAPPRRRG